MAKIKGRAKQFADLEEKPVKDYDPEAEHSPSDHDAASDDESDDDNAATEHYVDVGKSRLRSKQPLVLGPKYTGRRVAREALDKSDSEASSDYEDAKEELSEHYDDPDDVDLDDLENGEDGEIDSDDAFDLSDEERFKGFVFRGSSQALPVKGKRVPRPTAADFLDEEASESEDSNDDDHGEDSQGSEDDSENLDDSDLDGFIDDASSDAIDGVDSPDDEVAESEEEATDESSEEEDDDRNSKHPETSKNSIGGWEGDLKAIMQEGTRNVAESMANSIQKDIAKGVAVRKQRGAFDAALNIRIRLQKALIAANSLSTTQDAEDLSEPYRAAEAAAVKLWNAIDGFRAGMLPNAGQKRKRAVEVVTSTEDMWNSMEDTERVATARRKHVLENWSGKVKKMRTGDAASSTRNPNKFVKVEVPLTMLLENEMQDPGRLIKRTKIPRSCAPIHVARKISEDMTIYDDADFYQLMLKELVDQRSSNLGGQGQAATIRYAASKEVKNKKHVDTKASKGRKLRFNVHEKLQNFMAPQDLRSWEQQAIDRFFGTLFGQKMVLNEDEASDVDDGGVAVEEGGLRLFRS